METWLIWSIVGGVILLLILLNWYVQKKIKEKKARASYVPEEVLLQFEKAEKMLKESKGEKTPYEIMWEIANEERMKGGLNNNGEQTRTSEGRNTNDRPADNRVIVQTEPRTETASSDREPEGRSSIQEQPIAINTSNNGSITGNEQKDTGRRSFFSRFKKQQ